MRHVARALVVALCLTTALVPVTGQQASAQTVTNPDLVAACGVNITLIIDRSNSISNAEADDIRDAARALIRGLVGTGSRVQIITFATRAYSVVQSASSVYTQGDIADLTTYDASELVDLPSFYAPGDSEGGTNWDDALEVARRAPTITPLTVFLTDGAPTYRLTNTPDGHGSAIAGTGNTTSAADLSQALQEANYLRSGTHPAGTRPVTHLFGVGVGLTDATSETRLSNVTGPDELTLGAGGTVLVNGAPGEFATADYTIVPNFADLEFAFVRFVWALCSQDFTLSAQLQLADGTTVPGSSTTPIIFDVTVGPSAPQAWDLPPLTASASATLTSGADGTAKFRWRPTPPSSVATVLTTARGLPAGYLFNGVRCTTKNPATADPPVVVLDTVGPNMPGSTRGEATWTIPGGINIHLSGTCEVFFRQLRGEITTTEQLVVTASAASTRGGRPIKASAVIELDDAATTTVRVIAWNTE